MPLDPQQKDIGFQSPIDTMRKLSRLKKVQFAISEIREKLWRTNFI